MASKVFIASDHGGVELKTLIKSQLAQYDWEDFGTHCSERVDYPDFAEMVASEVVAQEGAKGILICNTGIGMCIAANKVAGTRAASVSDVESAKLTRDHNDSNILCLGAKILKHELALEIAKTWLETPFSDEARHIQRIRKIKIIEESE